MDDTASAVYAAAENDTRLSKAPLPGTELTSLRIEPQSSRQRFDARELWAFRELLFFFVWRDVKVRYKQTVLGAAWAVIQPLMTMVVFTIFFGKLGGMAGQVKGSYSVFVYAALLPWTFFANAVTQGALSLVGSSHLISKVYFPRVLVPIAAIASGLVDFSIAFCVMLALMIANGVSLTWQVLTLPLFIVGTLATATGASMLLSALVVAYRDFRYVVGFLVQIWMFASPVIYPLDIVPEGWRLAYATNPMVGMISGFRSATLGEPFATSAIAVSSIVAAMLLVGGAQYFLQVQRRFADIT
jgi:lipopolysaccharide transport system permease protein